jgi:putative RecB family exonuclease
MIYSHSSISSFKNCPLQFKFNYIEKPDIDKKQNVEAFMGSVVHKCLEKLYKDLKFNKQNSLEFMLDFYEKEWNTNYSENKVEIIRKEYTVYHYKSLGKNYLINYYKKYKPFNDGKVIGLEQQVNITLYDDQRNKNYYLVGYIDRLTLLSDNHIEIGDYKTNLDAKTQSEVDQDKQLALYSIAIKEQYPFIEKIDLAWYFLSAGIKQISSRTDEQLEQLKKEIINNIRYIEDAIEKSNFPGKVSGLCDWCPFRSICPLKAHDELSNTPSNIYLKKEGVDLVDKYNKLIEIKKELTKDINQEIELVKEALFEYSKNNNFQKIIGTNNSIIIREYDSITLPEKNSDKRVELELLIKNNNLWNELSDLSYMEISKFLKNDFFSNEFKNKLLKYIKINKIQKFYINKNK